MHEELTLADYLTRPVSELMGHPNFSLKAMEKVLVLAQMKNREITRLGYQNAGE